MAKFGSLEEFFDPTITLPVKGKDYIPPLPSAELGLWCRTLTQSAAVHEAASNDERSAAFEQLSKLPDIPGWGPGMSFQQLLLGDTYQQMMADGVEHPYIDVCAGTVLVWILYGEEAAQRYWESGGRPEAARPANNRAERRAAQRAGGQGTGGATTTPPPTSGSGTRTSRPRRRRPARS